MHLGRLAGALFLLTTTAGQAATLLNPGGDVEFGPGYSYGSTDVHIHNADCPDDLGDPAGLCAIWGDPTHVEVVTGATAPNLFIYEDSTLNVSDGSVRSLQARDSSATTLTGGEVGTLDGTSQVQTFIELFDDASLLVDGEATVTLIVACDQAEVEMRGGFSNGSLVIGCDSVGLLNGGHVGNNADANTGGVLTIASGRVGAFLNDGTPLSRGDINAYQDSHVIIKGGRFAGWMRATNNKSRVTVMGIDFAVDGEPVDYGELELQSGRLTGTLQSGDPLDNEFRHAGWSFGDNFARGTITLVEAPEPESALLGAAAITCLGAIRARQRRALPA